MSRDEESGIANDPEAPSVPESLTMVARGTFGKYSPGKPGPTLYWTLVVVLIAYALGGGYYAGIQPIGQWRYFSWHPFLMMCGMVGMAGIGALTKKLGGYTNTKSHAILAGGANMLNFAGLYCIYKNKEMNGYKHMQSTHAWSGVLLMFSTCAMGFAGSVFLHPDFGIDKTNKTIRLYHKMFSRFTLVFSWMNCVIGLSQLIPLQTTMLFMFAMPLVLMVPLVLM